MVHQDLPHGAGGHGEKVRPVGGGQGDPAELEVGLVHQGCGVQGPLAVLVAKLPPRQPAEIIIEERDEPLEGRRLSLTRAPQQPRNFAEVEPSTVHD